MQKSYDKMTQRSNITFRRRPLHGFTLIELLVVIAIIALLVSILMPALKTARQLATGAVCLANQKTMSLAYIMYALENDDYLAGGWALMAPLNGVPSWVKPPLKYGPDGTQIYMGADQAVNIEHRYNGIREWLLYEYIEDVDAYHCPGDRRETRGTSHGSDDRYRLFRSYTLPDFYKATERNDERKLSGIKQPTKIYLFVEDNYDGAAAYYCHDGWSFTPWNNSLWDPLGLYHNDACSFSFVDGHAEIHKWEDERTLMYFTNRSSIDRNQPDNPDITWLSEHYPAKTRFKWGDY